MRRTTTLLALGIVAISSAEVPNFGTKPDMVVNTPEQPTSLIGAWDMVQMLVALVIVFALLKWALPKVVARMNKKLVTTAGSSISVEESANFGGGNLQIITARGRTLLLCVSQSGVSCLADLTDSPEQRDTEPAFFEMVDQATERDEEELRAVVQIDHEEDTQENDLTEEAQAVLARLERLTR